MRHHHQEHHRSGGLSPRRGSAGSVAAAVAFLAFLLLACDSTTAPVPVGHDVSAEVPRAVLQGPPAHAAAILEHAWAGDRMWEMVKPRPPGLGTPEDQAVPFYVLAPMTADAPLSPPIGIPDVISIGGRDHVVPVPRGNGGTFRGTAITVGLQHPGWEAAPPFSPAECETVEHDDRIAWAWVEVSGPAGHPCGQVAFVYAVELETESCPMPLTNRERVHAAIDQGLVNASRPPEPAWPVAIRPMTTPGGGVTAPDAPSGCVPAGERAG